MGAKKTKIPTFKTDDEERAFWAAHSVEEFADELVDLDVEIRPTRTEQIAIRLFPDDVAALRAEAEARGVGHTTLARSIVEGWVRSAARSPRQAPAGGTIRRSTRRSPSN